MKRAQTSFPSSPRKIRYIVESLAKSVGLSVNSSLSSCTLNYDALSENTKQEVLDFYNNDITWQAPGLKDRVIIREIGADGVKVKRTEQV